MSKSIYSRNSVGRNDNPNATEFASAFKKLLVCHPIITSVDHNVITNATGILTVSSQHTPKSNSKIATQNQFESLGLDFELEICYETVMMNEIEMMEPYEQHMCAFIALCIEEKFLENTCRHKNKCGICAHVLLASNERIQDELLAMKVTNAEKNTQPSSSSLKIVIFANAIMKMIFEENQQGNSSHAVCALIMENIDINDLYEDFDLIHKEQDEPNPYLHKSEFIQLLIETYMTMKSQKNNRCTTRSTHSV